MYLQTDNWVWSYVGNDGRLEQAKEPGYMDSTNSPIKPCWRFGHFVSQRAWQGQASQLVVSFLQVFAWAWQVPLTSNSLVFPSSSTGHYPLSVDMPQAWRKNTFDRLLFLSASLFSFLFVSKFLQLISLCRAPPSFLFHDLPSSWTLGIWTSAPTPSS